MGFVKGICMGMVFGAAAGMVIGASNCEYMQNLMKRSGREIKRFRRKYRM